MKLPKWIAWLLHRLPKDAKAKAFDVAVDKMSKPEKEVIGPRTKFNTGRLDYRDIENQKQPQKKGK